MSIIPGLLHWGLRNRGVQTERLLLYMYKKNTCKSLTDTHNRRIEADQEEEKGDRRRKDAT